MNLNDEDRLRFSSDLRSFADNKITFDKLIYNIKEYSLDIALYIFLHPRIIQMKKENKCITYYPFFKDKKTLVEHLRSKFRNPEEMAEKAIMYNYALFGKFDTQGFRTEL